MMIIGSVLNFARKVGIEQGAAGLADRWDRAKPTLLRGADDLIKEIFVGHTGAQDDAQTILKHLIPVADEGLRRLGGGRPSISERGRNRQNLVTAFNAANRLRQRASFADARNNWQDVKRRGNVQSLLSNIRQEAWKAAVTEYKGPTSSSTTVVPPTPVPVP